MAAKLLGVKPEDVDITVQNDVLTIRASHRTEQEARGAIAMPAGDFAAQKATGDADLLAAWWRQHPTHGVGIATGPRSGIWVLDVDGEASVVVSNRGPSDALLVAVQFTLEGHQAGRLAADGFELSDEAESADV